MRLFIVVEDEGRRIGLIIDSVEQVVDEDAVLVPLFLLLLNFAFRLFLLLLVLFGFFRVLLHIFCQYLVDNAGTLLDYWVFMFFIHNNGAHLSLIVGTLHVCLQTACIRDAWLLVNALLIVSEGVE